MDEALGGCLDVGGLGDDGGRRRLLAGWALGGTWLQAVALPMKELNPATCWIGHLKIICICVLYEKSFLAWAERGFMETNVPRRVQLPRREGQFRICRAISRSQVR